MKKVAVLICVVALMLTLSSVVVASPYPPSKFRIKGETTLIDLSSILQIGYATLKSEGSVIQHIQGDFFMDERAYPLDPTFENFWNTGTLSVITKKSDLLELDFSGFSQGETVEGEFYVVAATGAYASLIGTGGIYVGIADACDLGCVPIVDPECPLFFPDPECSGFYVDFTFDE